MNKKFFVSLAITLFTICSFTVCFANDGNMMNDATNGVKNFVGGVENTVENTARGASNFTKNVTGGMQNGAYTATRTSTDDTVMGMNSNTWTWLIVGIAAVAIIALIWYYSMQFANRDSHHDDE